MKERKNDKKGRKERKEKKKEERLKERKTVGTQFVCQLDLDLNQGRTSKVNKLKS